MPSPETERIIALGASNLTRGLAAFLATAAANFGPYIEVFAALGHGRSYGSRSRVLMRELPGILPCGLWQALEGQPRARTRALVTDIGNDLLYGFSPRQTLVWVSQALQRLQGHTDRIVITDLPMAGILGLSPTRFLIFRSILVPGCSLALREVQDRAEELSAGLAHLAREEGACLLKPEASWYGIDPVHIRRPYYPAAWRRWLCIDSEIALPPSSRLDALRLALLLPERRRLFGLEQTRRQAGYQLPSGGRLWLY